MLRNVLDGDDAFIFMNEGLNRWRAARWRRLAVNEEKVWKGMMYPLSPIWKN
jgi:hypothetical protein